MRMWMVEPQLLCRRHLLGEHVELHMLAGSILRGKGLEGFVKKGLLQPQAMHQRHKALTAEMCSRGYKHTSPLLPVDEALENYPEHIRTARVDVAKSLQDLAARCPDCAERMQQMQLQK